MVKGMRGEMYTRVQPRVTAAAQTDEHEEVDEAEEEECQISPERFKHKIFQPDLCITSVK
jgi:hypothetical protein